MLFLPLLFPHCPFTVEEPYFSMYNRSEMPLPISRDELVSRYNPILWGFCPTNTMC